MRKIFFLIFLISLISLPFTGLHAEDLSARLSGRILLQVEAHGEAWYVNPANNTRWFMGRPADAFAVMRELGLGISNADFAKFENNMPSRLWGKIIIKVEDLGKAFYVNATDGKLFFLGRPADAFAVMRKLGLGITNLSLETITENETSKTRRHNQERERKPEQNTGQNPNATSSGEAEEDVEEETEEMASSSNETASTTNEIATSSLSSACEFLAEYFKKETISGSANYSETVLGIDNEWGTGAPALLGDYNNKFAVRYTGSCWFAAGAYDFTAVFDDGLEATVDDFWIAKSWKDNGKEITALKTLELSEGYHTVAVKFFDHLGNATVKLGWNKEN